MKRKWKAAGKPAAAAAMALLLGALGPAPAYAAKSPLISGTETDALPAQGPALETGQEREPEPAAAVYTQEQLDDSLIEYGELEALVRAGNSTALASERSYQESLAVYQSAYDAMVADKADMEDKAEQLEDEDGDPALIAAYEASAQILSASARQYRRTLTSLNSVSSESSRDKTVWGQVKLAQTLMGTCKKLEDQAQTAQKSAEAAEAALSRLQNERSVGLCTEAELLAGQESLLQAKISAQNLSAQAASTKNQLAVLLGISGGRAASLTLGDVPEVTQEELASMDLEADKAIAVIADSSVKSIKNSRVSGDANRNLRKSQLAEAQGEASVSVDQQYETVKAMALARSAAASAYEAAQKDYQALQIRWQSGAISRAEYLQGEAQFYQKQAEDEAARIDLREAYDTYCWMQRGV